MNFLLPLTITLVVMQGKWTLAQKECTNDEVRLTEGEFVELCIDNEWQRMCTQLLTGKWNMNGATVFCRQLGYGDQGVNWGGRCSPTPINKYFSLSGPCNGTESRIQDCPGGVVNASSCTCTENFLLQADMYGTLECPPAGCSDGDVRLVDGDSCNEGRVEVCTGGRWGTVCNNSPELAGAACKASGFDSQRATVASFSPGIVPIHTCLMNDDNSLNCTQLADDSCDHTMDLGVVCRTQSDLNEIEDEIRADKGDSATTIIILGVIIAALIVVIIAMAIVWTCTALKKKNLKPVSSQNGSGIKSKAGVRSSQDVKAVESDLYTSVK